MEGKWEERKGLREREGREEEGKGRRNGYTNFPRYRPINVLMFVGDAVL